MRHLRSCIMRNKKGYPSGSQLHPPNLAKFISSLLCCDTVYCETALGVIDKAKILASFLNGDNIHETSWVCSICTDFTINFDEALHHDRFCLSCIQGILQTISKEDDERKRISKLMRTRRRARSIGTGKFVK